MISFPFLKKELKELVKTNKLIIFGALFIFFAILSPLTARFMTEIFNSIGGMDGFVFPPAVFTDSYLQFFSNHSLNVLVLALIISGTIVSEKNKGSLSLVLSKGLERRKLVLTKLFSYSLFFSFLYWISVAITYLYTYLLFEEAYIEKLFVAFFTTWLYGIFLIVLAIFISTISVSFGMAAGITFGAYTLVSIIGSIPIFNINRLSPSYLNSITSGIIYSGDSSHLLITTLSTIAIILILIYLSVEIFKNKEI
ncbi:ABC-2 type transport system permease protein [Natranaerovirga pectinivora]|uniref:ABC-2 type transport system permease protein n=1 Tax=Natranaerovirga pectinivora TaxID=682400 RepID=A0A4R3ML04_9FIRM|nr:ABC transporter permease [Natranaerovirga pectinivora]TCT14646.1 ABC-2 type transport system permease protein [Natranaerovirga pectinivora]